MNTTLRTFTCFLILSSASSVYSQTINKNWDKTYGGNSRDWNCAAATVNGESIFIIGDSQTGINGDKMIGLCNVQIGHSDIWLIKADTSGNVLWQKNYGGESDERSPKLILLDNPAREMIFTCYSTSNIACDKSEPNRDTVSLLSADYWIVKLDSSGVILWEKTLGGDNFDDYTYITELSSGDLLVAGESNSPVGYDKTIPNYSISNDFWVLKLDQSGSVLSDYVFGGDGGEFLSAIIPDNQGGYLLTGSTNSDVSGDVSEPGQGNFDFWMIKIDSQGNKEWDKRFGGTGPDRCNHAARTNDGGYILCGFTVSPQSGDVSEAPKGIQDYWVVRTDAVGNKLWDKRYGGINGSFGTFVQPDATGNYWIGGYTNSDAIGDVSEPTYGASDYWILKTDDTGALLSDVRYGGNNNDFLTGISILSDSTYLAFGYSDSGSSFIKTAASKGWYDYWMVKFTESDTTTSVKEITLNQQFSIYPNPSSAFFDVIPSMSEPTIVASLSLLDISGKRVLFIESVQLQNNQPYTIKTNELNQGVYQLMIQTQKGVSTAQVMITR